MKVVMVTRQDTDYTRESMDWISEFERETGIEVLIEDPETISGELFATHHDIVQYPCVCVLRDDDSKVIAKWAGKLPQIQEVTYTLRDA
ncbi:hypothetical protein IJF91_00115 [Candidatus Saccharibacteria bacterium]|nr:hypothetical protein [Candidatus Saccharibacteria bacterium]